MHAASNLHPHKTITASQQPALSADSLLKLACAMFGGSLFALGYRVFIIPMHLYSGGFTGISQIILYLLKVFFHLAPPENIDLTGIVLWLLNIPLLILCWRIVSRRFMIRTLATVLLQSVCMSLIPAPEAPLFENMFTCVLVGGAISGLGVGITLINGGCGGGIDTLGIYCAKKIHGFSVGRLSLLINSAIYLFGAVTGSLEIAVYSVIYSLVASLVMDRIHAQNITSCAFIITRKDEFTRQIIRQLNRGGTLWEGTGGYRNENTHIIMTAVSKYELRTLDKIIREVDPDAFITCTDNVSVTGNFEKRFDA